MYPAIVYMLKIILPQVCLYLFLGYASMRLLTLRIVHPMGHFSQIGLAIIFLYFFLCLYPSFTLFCAFIAVVVSVIKRMRNKEWRLFRFISEEHKQTFLSVSTAVFFLMVFEMFLRASGRYDSYTERNGGSYQSAYIENCMPGWYAICPPHISYTNDFSFPVNYNKNGFDDDEWQENDADSTKIACLGDSFTEGIGATAKDSTYPSLLKQMLGVRIMNAGLSGNDPVNNFMIFRDILTDYHPKTLTLTINSSDITDVIIRGGFERFAPDGSMQYRKAPWWETIYACSYISRHIILGRMKLNDMLLSIDSMPTEREKAFGILEQSIDSFQTECSKRNIRLVLVFHPSEFEIKDGLECQRLLDYAQAKGCETVDVRKYFINHGITAENASNYFWKFDCHNNPDGYKLFASALAEKLRTQ